MGGRDRQARHRHGQADELALRLACRGDRLDEAPVLGEEADRDFVDDLVVDDVEEVLDRAEVAPASRQLVGLVTQEADDVQAELGVVLELGGELAGRGRRCQGRGRCAGCSRAGARCRTPPGARSERPSVAARSAREQDEQVRPADFRQLGKVEEGECRRWRAAPARGRPVVRRSGSTIGRAAGSRRAARGSSPRPRPGGPARGDSPASPCARSRPADPGNMSREIEHREYDRDDHVREHEKSA